MPKTSIIMTSYRPVKMFTELTIASIASITKHTNPDNYELIIVDYGLPKAQLLRNDNDVLKIDKIITLDEDPGYYEAMNIGAREAQYNTLCFVENDIFVPDGWLERLTYYINRNILDVVLPDQLPHNYRDLQSFKKMNMYEAIGVGASEQGLIVMRREVWENTPWEKIKRKQGWRHFYERLPSSIRCASTAKVTIEHPGGMTYWYKHDFEKRKLNRYGE